MTDPQPQPDAELPQPAAPDARRCANCGAPLYGPFCHLCGQRDQHMIKHLWGLAGDAAGLLFNLDSRLFRTLPALYLRPGLLLREYFAGRRTRYIAPFRLVFFLSVLAFLLIQLDINLDQNLFETHTHTVTSAATPGEGHRHAPATATTTAASAAPATAPGSVATPPTPPPTPAPPPNAEIPLHIGGGNTNIIIKPVGILLLDSDDQVDIGWLPDFVNDRINHAITQVRANIKALRHHAPGSRRRFVGNIVSVLPQTLFVLLPIFALLLKFVYVFKRRLYIEHLLVAMSSHAFIFLSLLLSALLVLIGFALPAGFDPLLGWLQKALWLWIPIYLLLAQKRVYGQGWLLTVLKFGFVGVCYCVLLSFAVSAEVMIGLAS